MVDKRIYYIWLGSGKQDTIFWKCLESWKRHCQDFEIVKVDESNFDISSNPVVKNLYDKRQYAAVSDIIRAKVLYDNSGVYMDNDLELIRPINELMKYSFVAYKVPASIWKLNTAFMISNKGNSILKRNLEEATSFEIPLATLDRIICEYDIGNPDEDTYIEDMAILGMNSFILPNQNITSKTYGIHHTKREWANNTDLLSVDDLKKIKAIGIDNSCIS